MTTSGLSGCALLAALALGCGSRGTAGVPRARPTVELVQCRAALPRPMAAGDADEAMAELVNRRSRAHFRSRRADDEGGAVTRRPTVSLGTPHSSGPLDAGAVATGVRGELDQLTQCYVAARGVPSKAVVSYRLVIRGNGRMAAAAASGALGGPLDTCVRRVLGRLRFPAKGTTTTATIALVFDATGAFATATSPVQKLFSPPEPWTPFAIGPLPGGMAATSAARITEAVLRSRLVEIERCFAKSSVTGSMRMILELDLAGDLKSVRVGGLGDHDGERCAAKAVADLHVATPLQEHVEVACDLARGNAEPWRIAIAAGYEVIEAEPLQLRHGTQTVVPGSSDPPALPENTYVVVGQPDTPGGLLQLAMMWARDADSILLAVADGQRSPVFLGMASSSSSRAEDDDAIRAALRIGRTKATGCVGRSSATAEVSDPHDLGILMRKLAERCHRIRCAPTLVVAIDSDAVTRDLLEVAGAARRAGFDRVLFGGNELGCSLPSKRSQPDDDDGELELE